jgi:hypothetical protein
MSCTEPAGAYRHRSISRSVARTKVGTNDIRSECRNIGAQVWRCHFQSAPSLVRMPLPSSGPRMRTCTRLSNLSRCSSSTVLIRPGSVTHTIGGLPPASGTKSSS